MSFLVRTRALPESERQLKRAVEIAQDAATELPRTGRLCRILPDALGKGAKACWGIKWEEKWDFGISHQNGLKPTEAPAKEKFNKEETLKMFEDEVKKANLQLLSKETIFGPEAPNENGDEEIDTQITSPEPKSPKVATHTLEKPNWALAPDNLALHPPSPLAQPSPPVIGSESASRSKRKGPQISDDESEDSEEDPRSWASPTGRPPTRSQKLAEKAAWFPPATQPLMGILGMTVLPLRYESGIAERSLRKVTSVLKPGEGSAGGKWRGVEEELVKRLARVVLAPWPDWDDGGMAPQFKTPTLVSSGTPSSSDPIKGEEGSENGKSTQIGHDPLKGDIIILVETIVANSLNVGMGVAGTWVQLVPLRSENFEGGRGYNHSRGSGRGRRGANSTSGAAGAGKEPRLWYVEELFMAIPSFWTVGEEMEGIDADEEDIDNVGMGFESI